MPLKVLKISIVFCSRGPTYNSQEDLHHAKAEGPLAKKRKLETSFLGSDNDSQRSGESDNVPQMKHGKLHISWLHRIDLR